MLNRILYSNKHPYEDNGNPYLVKEISPDKAFPILFFNQFRPLYYRFFFVFGSRSFHLSRGNRSLDSYLLNRFFFVGYLFCCYFFFYWSNFLYRDRFFLYLLLGCLLLYFWYFYLFFFEYFHLFFLWNFCILIYRGDYFFLCHRLKFHFRFGRIALSWSRSCELLQLSLY